MGVSLRRLAAHRAPMSVRIVAPLLRGPRSAVVAAHPLAVAAGTEVLATGGNAVDAAVAAGAALAVVTPDACGLGGDALLLVNPPGGPPVAYVGAAALPHRPMLPVTVHGSASVGVPGAVAAWAQAHARHGRLTLSQALAPSLELADRGFPVSAGLVAAVTRRRERLEVSIPAWPVLDAVPGSILRQPELAATLEAISAEGAAGFYQGPVAAAICQAVGTAEGRGISTEDLAGYSVVAQAPVTGTYGLARISVVPPPSQALLAVLALEALQALPDGAAPDTVRGQHAAIETIKEVFELRAALAAGGDVKALRSTPIPQPGRWASRLAEPTASDHTAAVVTADGDGLVVSMLVSVFHEFGSGVLVADAGFLLNNRLSGLAAGTVDPSRVPAGWRPGHTLSPMLLELSGRRLGLATPGADGQVQTLVQIVRLLTDAGAGLSAALHAPRWRAVEGRLAVEASFDDCVRKSLMARGHLVDLQADGDPLFGGAAVAGSEPGGGVVCAADPRREVWAAVR